MTAHDLDVAGRLAATRILPVVTIDDADAAVPAARALGAGGLPLIEITLRTPAALEAIDRVRRDVPDTVVGAGSVMTPADVDAAVQRGAAFVVSPGFDERVVETARSLDVLSIPGISTATELQRASGLAIGLVKVFPAALVGGPALIEAFSAVFPSMRFLPTGGITAASAGSYLDLPSVPAVGGSWMVPKRAVADRDWSAIERLSASAVEQARSRG